MEIKEFTREEVDRSLRRNLRPLKECVGKTLLGSYTDWDTVILIFTDGTFAHLEADSSSIEESKSLYDIPFFEKAGLLPMGTYSTIVEYERQTLEVKRREARYQSYLDLRKEFGPLLQDIAQ